MPATSPLSRPLDVVLHVGMGKTGTSSVQFFLRDNRQRLSELGCLYPRSPGGARHGHLSLYVKTDAELQSAPEWQRHKESDPGRFRKTFRRRLFSEIESSGLSRILLSDEVLFSASDQALRRLGRFTGRIADNLRVVVYLRRQDDHMVSRYQQGVKIGWVQRLHEWAQEDMSGLYDYDARLRLLERRLPPADFVVRRYEPGSFVDGSLYQDFLAAAGVDARADELKQVTNRNESLDAESVEFLRLLNLHRVENEAATPGLIDNRRLVPLLAGACSGPVLTLPGRALDEFMAQWRQANEAVARRWLEDPAGELFHTPRRTADTTTEQRLDPGRLEHFLTLLDLPEHLHAPLRELAEREAVARG